MGNLPTGAAALRLARKALLGKIPLEANGVNWLGRKKGSGAYQLDILLLKGIADSKPGEPRGGLSGHIDSLRKLGIEVVRGGDELWRITGMPHVGKSAGTAPRVSPVVERKRKPITDAQYRLGYELGRDLFFGNVAKSDAVAQLVAIGTNKVSAANMLYITAGLLAGKVFKRALKDEAYAWYLEWILRDFGPEGLRTALKGAWAHLEYRESDGADKSGIRRILERFEHILKGEPVEEEGGIDNSDARGGKGREKKQAWVTLRYGQPDFRENLMLAYNGRCAVTESAVERVLVAAHIKPYAHEGESRVSNGMLLRADIHLLFDAHLLGIDPDTYRVKLSPALQKTEYWELNGREIKRPKQKDCWPDKRELAEHLLGIK